MNFQCSFYREWNFEVCSILISVNIVSCFLFCFVRKPRTTQVVLETGHVVDLFQWTLWVVCFSSRRRDPQALCQAVLPTNFIGRSTPISCFIAACQAPVKLLHLLGLGDSLFIYRLTLLLSVNCIQTLDCWFSVVISLL